jgi:hypothetical protein
VEAERQSGKAHTLAALKQCGYRSAEALRHPKNPMRFHAHIEALRHPNPISREQVLDAHKAMTG